MAKNSNRVNPNTLIIITLITIIVLCIIFRFTLLYIYRDTPVSELPTWVYWLLHE